MGCKHRANFLSLLPGVTEGILLLLYVLPPGLSVNLLLNQQLFLWGHHLLHHLNRQLLWGSSSSSGIGLCLFLGLDSNLTLFSFCCIFPAPFGLGSCTNSPAALGLYWGGVVFQADCFITSCPVVLWRLIHLSALICLRHRIFSLVITLGVWCWLQYFLQLDELQGSISIPKCPLVVFTNNSASTISWGTLRDISTSPHPSLVQCTDTSGFTTREGEEKVLELWNSF